jgi:ABC-type uncharacterized transport system permease subunit
VIARISLMLIALMLTLLIGTQMSRQPASLRFFSSAEWAFDLLLPKMFQVGDVRALAGLPSRR